MYESAKEGYVNATDLADYLVGKGLAFRDAYNVSGRAVSLALARECRLEELSIEDFKSLSELIDEDVYKRLDLATCVERRLSVGGTSSESVKGQIEYIRNKLAER